MTSDGVDSFGEIWDISSDDISSDEDTSSPHQIAQWKFDGARKLVGNGIILDNLSGHISAVWKQVGRNLRIKDAIIENIDIEHEQDGEREKAYQLLLIWTRQRGSQATLDDLLNVLVYIGRNDIANAISVSNKHKRASVCSERAIKTEIKSHTKLQKKVMKKLEEALEFYQERLKEVEDLQCRVFEREQDKEMKRKLQELDSDLVQRKLESLQRQIYKMHGQKYSELDKHLRIIADKLFELDKTFERFNDDLDDLSVSYYSQLECHFVGLCYFRHIKFPRQSGSGAKHVRSSSKGDEELDDHVFEDSPVFVRHNSKSSRLWFNRNKLNRASLSRLFPHHRLRRKKTHAHPHRAQEEHVKRKLGVSIVDMDEQFQLEDFMTKFCCRYRQDRSFSESCLHLQSTQVESSAQTFDTLPRYQDLGTRMSQYDQSTEAIMPLVRSPYDTLSSRGFVNVVSDREISANPVRELSETVRCSAVYYV